MAKNSSRLVATYERGDIVSARQMAEQTLTDAPSDKDAAMARDILDRTRFNHAVWIYVAVAVGAFVVLTLLGIRNGS